MSIHQPRSKEELAEILRSSGEHSQSLNVQGAGSKHAMGGPVAQADATVDTTSLDRLLQYEPRDLTISVEAGMRWAKLASILGENRQMIPLDPPFAPTATVGGIVAANTAGPRRRLYGTVRDQIIGMQFATLEGKVIQSGGMVVKNVAGLDMGKLMIGSFGTLAAIAVVNFKLMPMPLHSATFVRDFDSLEAATKYRSGILEGILQPSSLDIVNPAAAAMLGMHGWNTVIHVDAPSEVVLQRYDSELGGDVAPPSLMQQLAEFTPSFLASNPEGAVVRVSTTLEGVGPTLAKADGPAIARAATGVVYRYHSNAADASLAGEQGAIEFAPDAFRSRAQLWPEPGSDFQIMKRVKEMFDPKGLLNRGRLYGRI